MLLKLKSPSYAERANSQSSENRVGHSLPRVRVHLLSDLPDRLQNPEMLLLKFLERLVELVVPWVQDEDLEAKCGRGDGEVRQGNETCDNHLGGGGGERVISFLCSFFRQAMSAQELLEYKYEGKKSAHDIQ